MSQNVCLFMTLGALAANAFKIAPGALSADDVCSGGGPECALNALQRRGQTVQEDVMTVAKDPPWVVRKSTIAEFALTGDAATASEVKRSTRGVADLEMKDLFDLSDGVKRSNRTGDYVAVGAWNGVSVLRKFTVNPKKEQEFAKAYENFARVAKENKGCHIAELFKNPREAGTLYSIEHYDSEAQFDEVNTAMQEKHNPELQKMAGLTLKPNVVKLGKVFTRRPDIKPAYAKYALLTGFETDSPSDFRNAAVTLKEQTEKHEPGHLYYAFSAIDLFEKQYIMSAELFANYTDILQHTTSAHMKAAQEKLGPNLKKHPGGKVLQRVTA